MRGFRTKSIKAEIKDVDESSRIVKGYISVFENVDVYNERVKKGAFVKTIKENGPTGTGRIRHFLDHNLNKSIGVFQELKEDDYGLHFTSKLGRHTLGNDVLIMYIDGLITEHSIGYDVIRDEKAENDVIELKEVKLWEGSSLQSWGANDKALVTDVKMEQIEAIENILRNSKMSDETIKQIELQIKIIKETLEPQEAPEPLDYDNYYKSLNLRI